MMKTKKILLFVVFAVLLLSVIGCSNKSPEYEPPKVEALINGESVELMPDVDVHNGNAGGIWDSPANELPMAFVSNGDAISVVFLDEAPRTASVRKYDIFDMEDVIGNPNSHSGPIDIEAIYQEAAVSFGIVQEKSAHQLITVIGEWDTQEVQYAFVISIEDEPEQIPEKATLEQALQEYAMQIVPGDGFHFGWKQLAEEEAGEKGTAYGVLLFHSSSGSPLIFSEKTGYYCSAIYSTYLLPISVSYEKDTNGSYTITDCWTPSEENYEQDLLAHFPPDTADLVLENLDQYTTEILEEIAEHDAERVQVFFPGGPVWPEYSFNEELDNTELCGLAGYYPVGDIYYEPVHNELIRRFKDDPVGLLNGLSLCNEETQSAVRNLIAAEVGASKLEAGLLALESEHEEQAPAKLANKESTKPAAPPTDEDIRAALIANHASVEELHMGALNTSTPFQTEGWLVLAEEDDTTTHTVYLLTHHAIYDLLGSGTQTKYEAAAFCHHTTALTFLWQDDRWHLLEYWLPGDGAYYEADIRATFPAEAVDKLFGKNASLYDNDVARQCDDAAVRYYTQLTNWVPAKTFYPSDVEFSGQTLYTSADTMTYEERLAWAQAGEDNGQIWPACTGQYSEGEGCIAYVEKIVAGRYPDLSLRLRFADGATSESLPLPRAGGYDTALPESMEFRDGKFIYEIVFTAEALSNEGQTLIHLEGTYHYEVDLTAKTVSLTVLQ